MISYKKVFEKFTLLIKQNKVVLLFGLLIAISSGLTIFTGIINNYLYFINHKYFITFTSSFDEFFTVFKSIFYNNIIPNIGESITSLFNLKNIYSGLQFNLDWVNLVFNLIILFIIFIIFIIANISSFFIIAINTKKQKLSELVGELKTVFLKSFLLDFLRISVFTLILVIISLIGILFNLNSYLYIIIAFTISFVLFYFIYFIFQYSIRYVIFFKQNIKQAIINAFKLFKSTFVYGLKNLIVLLGILLSFFVVLFVVALPFLMLSFYFIDQGYGIFTDIVNIFIFILVLMFLVLGNIFTLRYWNEVFADLTVNNK